MQTFNVVKQPVAVSIIVEKDGRVFPIKVLGNDGHTYKIDRVMRVERAASTKVVGCGIRYTVMVEGLPRYLYDEEGKWFMEDEVVIEVDT